MSALCVGHELYTQWRQIHELSASGNVQGLSDCLKTSDLSAITHKGKNALHIAAKHGHLEVVTFLLEEYPHMADKITIKRKTVLHCALKSKNRSLFELLLPHCSNFIVNVSDSNGMTVFEHVMVNGLTDLAIKIMEQAPYIFNVRHPRSILHIAVYQGNYDVVQYILKACPLIIRAVTRDGKTAMHFVRNQKIAEILNRADSNLIWMRDELGTTPFLNAIRCSSLEIIQFLLDLVPNVIHQKDIDGCNALHLASCPGVARTLLAKKPELIYETTFNGETPLHFYATFHEKAEMLKVLLEYAPEILHERNERGQTPLQCAKTPNNINAILRFKPDLLTDNENDNTGLHFAVLAGNNDVITLVFAKQTQSLYKTNRKKETPMHIAVKVGNRFAAQLFQPHITIETALEVYHDCVDNCEWIKHQITNVSDFLLPELSILVYQYVSKNDISYKPKRKRTC